MSILRPKLEDNLKLWQMEGDYNFWKMEHNLIFLQSGRQPQLFMKMKDNLNFNENRR